MLSDDIQVVRDAGKNLSLRENLAIERLVDLASRSDQYEKHLIAAGEAIRYYENLLRAATAALDE